MLEARQARYSMSSVIPCCNTTAFMSYVLGIFRDILFSIKEASRYL